MTAPNPNLSDLLARVEGSCETCAYWKFEEPDWQFDKLKFGKCTAIKQRETIIGTDEIRAIDDWEERENAEMEALAAVKAIAVDGSGYYAAVQTAGDFGCVLHSPLIARDLAPTPPEGEGL